MKTKYPSCSGLCWTVDVKVVSMERKWVRCPNKAQGRKSGVLNGAASAFFFFFFFRQQSQGGKQV